MYRDQNFFEIGLIIPSIQTEQYRGHFTPPETTLNLTEWKNTTNSLEGGFNSPLKLLARTHRGRKGERQRKMLDWWLHSKTQLPDDPIEIARRCNFGQDQLAKVNVLTTTNENHADQETGRPALYDNTIPTTYTQHRNQKTIPLTTQSNPTHDTSSRHTFVI